MKGNDVARRTFRWSHITPSLVIAINCLLCTSPGSHCWATIVTRIAPDGEAYGDAFGYSVSAGDVNGDGYADVMIGAPYSDVGGTDAGRAYVYYGGPGADETADWVLTGNTGGTFGFSLSTAGDVNSDGFSDFIVGAPGDIDHVGAGRAYLFLGGPSPDAVADLVLAGALGEQGLFGTSVASAGDVNGDGYSDVIVGAPYEEEATYGRVYLYYGGPTMDATPDLIITNRDDPNAPFLFGESVSSAGDMNGDGYDDMIVGAATALGYVYYGGTAPDMIADIVLHPHLYPPGDDARTFVSSVGDVNADGFDDVYIKAQYSIGTIYYGAPAPSSSPGLALVDSIGIVVAAFAGDVNGDTVSDIVAGWGASRPRLASAQATLYFGGSSLDESPDLTLIEPNEWFGHSVSSAGDFDGDGRSEIIVGAPFGSPSSIAGKAYVYGLQGLAVSFDLEPAVLNTAGHGRWLTGFIEPVGFDPGEIDVGTLRLEKSIPAEVKPVARGDHDLDGNPDLMVKFSREALLPLLAPGSQEISLEGVLFSGQMFSADVSVRLISPASNQMVAVLSRAGELPVVFAGEGVGVALADLNIYDVSGRLVRGLKAPAHGKLSWDGRSDNGAPVHSGVYFARPRLGSAVKVVIAR